MYILEAIGDNEYKVTDTQTGKTYVWPGGVPAEIMAAVTAEVLDYERGQTESKAPAPTVPSGRTGSGGNIGGKAGGSTGFWGHSPSGWGQGGWHPGGSPWTAPQHNQAYVDNWRIERGMDPLYDSGGPGGKWGNPLSNNHYHPNYQKPGGESGSDGAESGRPAGPPWANMPQAVQHIMQQPGNTSVQRRLIRKYGMDFSDW